MRAAVGAIAPSRESIAVDAVKVELVQTLIRSDTDRPSLRPIQVGGVGFMRQAARAETMVMEASKPKVS